MIAYRVIQLLSVFLIVLMVWFPGLYVSELLRSFLPYHVVLGFFLVVLSLVVFRCQRKKYNLLHKLRDMVVMIALLGFSVWGLVVVDAFYTVDDENRSVVVSEENGLRVFYANIYAYNNSHEALREQILSYDADVVLLVEFSDHQYRQMNDFWEEHYPYVNHVRENNLYGFNLIASKYPFAREYYEMEDEWVALESFLIEQEVNDDLMVHLVHSASPASASVFEQRNRQLETITDVMEGFTASEDQVVHLLVGDLNLSPWSVYYDGLVDRLGDDWVNVTQQSRGLMTRSLPVLGFIQSHIDHAFVQGGVGLVIEDFDVMGSDHRGFVLDLY